MVQLAFEYLVSAVLRIGLGEHHQFDVGGVPSRSAKAAANSRSLPRSAPSPSCGWPPATLAARLLEPESLSAGEGFAQQTAGRSALHPRPFPSCGRRGPPTPQPTGACRRTNAHPVPPGSTLFRPQVEKMSVALLDQGEIRPNLGTTVATRRPTPADRSRRARTAARAWVRSASLHSVMPTAPAHGHIPRTGRQGPRPLPLAEGKPRPAGGPAKTRISVIDSAPENSTQGMSSAASKDPRPLMRHT